MAQTRPASLTRQNAAVCELLLDGGWRRSQATEASEVFNPSTGDVIARVPMGGREDVDLVVASAKKAFLTGTKFRRSNGHAICSVSEICLRLILMKLRVA